MVKKLIETLTPLLDRHPSLKLIQEYLQTLKQTKKLSKIKSKLKNQLTILKNFLQNIDKFKDYRIILRELHKKLNTIDSYESFKDSNRQIVVKGRNLTNLLEPLIGKYPALGLLKNI